jgi:hypothetical protein
MADRPVYRWFVASVWPDEEGVPSAAIFEWDREAGKLGGHVRTVRFGPELSFNDAVAQLHYEVVEGQLSRSVTAQGVLVALRRELVPVYVPAREPAYA